MAYVTLKLTNYVIYVPAVQNACMGTTSKKTFGVNVTDDIANKIDEPLEYGDSRSERVRTLLQLGLEIESIMDKNASDIDRGALRQAMLDYKRKQ